MARRTEQFVRSGSYSYSSGSILSLIKSANLLLRSAASEATASAYLKQGGHSSYFAPSSIVLGVMAFEHFAKFLVVGLSNLPDTEIQVILDKKPVPMLDYLAKIFGTACAQREDFAIAVEVRHEIAHHYPRPGAARENFPEWYGPLDMRGLFIKTGNPAADFNFGQKLGSFALAFWVNRVVAETVEDLLRCRTHALVQMHDYETSNFRSLLHDVPSPETLMASAKKGTI